MNFVCLYGWFKFFGIRPPGPSSATRDCKAFTLLEVLLCVAILGIVLGTIYSSFSSVMRVQERIQSRVDRDARDILISLFRDLRSAYLGPADDRSLRFVGSRGTLDFVTVAPLARYLSNATAQDLWEVGYSLSSDGPPKARSSVMRRVDTSLDDNIFEGGRKRSFSGMVKRLEFTYDNGTHWSEAWDSNEALPKAVHILLELDDPGQKRSRLLTTTVEILRRFP